MSVPLEMRNVVLLRPEEFEHRRHRLWDEFYERLIRWLVVQAVGFTVAFVSELLLPAGYVPKWIVYGGLAIWLGGFAAMVVVEGFHFERLLRKRGLRCPYCDGRLAGSARGRYGFNYIPGVLDQLVQRTGECQQCRARVLLSPGRA